jgi:hypothetical protein
MGWLLIVSIAAMTSVMTMVQLIALTITLPISPAPQANGGSRKTESIGQNQPEEERTHLSRAE